MWLFGIARNVLLSHARSAIKTERLASLLHDRSNGSVYEMRTESIDLERALLALPEAKRELVLLVNGDGLSIAEAASVLSLNASTARSRYSAALTELRTLLESSASKGASAHHDRAGPAGLRILPQP